MQRLLLPDGCPLNAGPVQSEAVVELRRVRRVACDRVAVGRRDRDLCSVSPASSAPVRGAHFDFVRVRARGPLGVSAGVAVVVRVLPAEDADHQVRRGGRRSRRKDVPPHLLHDQQIPIRICANGERVTKSQRTVLLIRRTRDRQTRYYVCIRHAFDEFGRIGSSTYIRTCKITQFCSLTFPGV